MTVLTGSYDLWLVALSVVIAILAAGAALDVVARVAATRGRARASWLVGGAFAMGLGIWSMHYTGMLAFRLPVPVLYHVPTVTLSLLAAVAASLMALHVASREHLSRARTAVGPGRVGAGAAPWPRMAAVELDRQRIERRDFPVSRRGYDPAAVDAHLRDLAETVERELHTFYSRA